MTVDAHNFLAIAETCHRRVFTIAGQAGPELLHSASRLLNSALEAGTTLEDFLPHFRALLAPHTTQPPKEPL